MPGGAAGEPSPGTHKRRRTQQQQQQQQAHSPEHTWGTGVDGSSMTGGASHHQQHQQQQHEQQQRQRRWSGTPAAASPAAAACAAPALALPPQQPPPPPQQQQQAMGGQVSWLLPTAAGDTAASPHRSGAAAPSPLARSFRTHYSAFQLRLPPPATAAVADGAPSAAAAAAAAAGSGPFCRTRVVRLGDFVLVPPLPGDPGAPRVVQLTSLWQETPADGVPRLLGRGTRFYHPSDTMFAIPGDQVRAASERGWVGCVRKGGVFVGEGGQGVRVGFARATCFQCLGTETRTDTARNLT
jgi:hypothetical protein